MALTLGQTAAEALSLEEKERARLAHLLIASLEHDEGDSSDEWDTEIARRVQQIDRGEARGRPSDEVIREIRAHYR
ncbi:MAG: addiction module protein [Candidatus Eisenbacteria bacterium]|jgi:hypothetical protein|nr:addiction module protein [Candidatus Eisenbacteria bacterium]